MVGMQLRNGTYSVANGSMFWNLCVYVIPAQAGIQVFYVRCGWAICRKAKGLDASLRWHDGVFVLACREKGNGLDYRLRGNDKERSRAGRRKANGLDYCFRGDDIEGKR